MSLIAQKVRICENRVDILWRECTSAAHSQMQIRECIYNIETPQSHIHIRLHKSKSREPESRQIVIKVDLWLWLQNYISSWNHNNHKCSVVELNCTECTWDGTYCVQLLANIFRSAVKERYILVPNKCHRWCIGNLVQLCPNSKHHRSLACGWCQCRPPPQIALGISVISAFPDDLCKAIVWWKCFKIAYSFPSFHHIEFPQTCIKKKKFH